MLLNCGVGEESWESLGLQGDQTSQFKRKSVLNIHWTDWYWSWNSNTLATWCKELTHWKRPWCWLRLKAGGEGDDQGWDDWMASLTRWTWVWAGSGSWWWTGNPGVLQSWSPRVKHDWTELNWFIHKNALLEKDLFSTILCESLNEPSINTGGPEKSFVHWSTKYFVSTSYHEWPFCWKHLNCYISIFILKNIYKQQISK